MITFIEDTESNYQHRTKINAGAADATIVFAMSFGTVGELLTKKAVYKANKLYIPLDLSMELAMDTKKAKIISNMLIENNCHSLNIAGNGLYRLKHFNISQEECDNIVYTMLNNIILSDPNLKITSIRSGGQTGVDESGIKAAEKLGIDSICYCPKGWRFRTETTDISNEVEFKKRFKNVSK